MTGLIGQPSRRIRRPETRTARRGTILVATMWILIVLAGMVLVLARAMRIEGGCSANHLARQQASAIESGAIQYVLANLDGLTGQVPSDVDMPCQCVRVGDGAFWILRPEHDDGKEAAYGVVDEASKLNVNTVTAEMLSPLPGMTPEVAAAILDWRDSDSVLSEGGAESEFYLLLRDPYECKNAPLETVEEMLLVKLADKELLFGEDTNRNGILDDNENDADETDPPDNRDGKLDGGIYNLVTVYSSESNVSDSGSGRLNVNQAGTADLSRVLGESVSAERLGDILNRTRLGRPFQNILDFYYRTGMKPAEFRPIADRLTTSNQQRLRGLINVSTAPTEVLLCLPGLEEADADALVAARSGENADTSSISWVTEALPQAKAVSIGSYITSRSYQFSADIVSVTGNGRAFRRCRIVVDTSSGPPRVIYRQDLTSLGWPLSEEILLELRSGTPLEDLPDATNQEIR